MLHTFYGYDVARLIWISMMDKESQDVLFSKPMHLGLDRNILLDHFCDNLSLPLVTSK